MKEIRMLLDNFWIDKKKNREEYFEIRRKENILKKFFIEKTNWKLISNEKVMKLEKKPAKAENFMGIESFKEKMDYCILCGLLIFLEEKEDGEPFILEEIIKSIEFSLKDYLELDWIKFTHRKSLVRAFEYAENMRLLEKTEGDIKKFSEDRETEVLYEKTGLSRYFSVNFVNDISNFQSYKDFETVHDEEIDITRGDYRVNRVYRKLLVSPAVYWEDVNDSDRIYIKNQKPALESNLENILEGKLHIHKNGAFLVFDDKKTIGESHPKGTMLAEIVLLICGEIKNKVCSEEIKKELNDLVYISEEKMKSIINECIKNYSINWSKEYRDLSENKIFENIMEYMEEWMLAERNNSMITIYPGAVKIIGKYRGKNKQSNTGDENE